MVKHWIVLSTSLQSFEQEGLNIWNIVSQNVCYLTICGLLLPLNPGEIAIQRWHLTIRIHVHGQIGDILRNNILNWWIFMLNILSRSVCTFGTLFLKFSNINTCECLWFHVPLNPRKGWFKGGIILCMVK